MKKFLVVVIFLIPTIVVFSLSMTSTILSMSTPDIPTGIVIRDSFNKIVERDPAIMPGQPVPNSFELYARLTGISEDLYIIG